MQELPYEIIHCAVHGPLGEAATREAFAQLYRHYDPCVRKIVGGIAAWTAQEAQDLCQEVWCHLLGNGRRRLQAYEPSRSAFSNYLKKVTRFETLGILRLRRMMKIGRGAALDSVDELMDERTVALALELAQRDELDKLVAAAAEEFGPDYFVVLVEVLVRERSCVDVARELGVKENTIYQRKVRARKKLRQILDELRRKPTSKPPKKPSPQSPFDEASVSVMTKALLVLLIVGG